MARRYHDEDEYHDERLEAALERKLARRYCTECKGVGGHHVGGCPEQGEDEDPNETEDESDDTPNPDEE